MNPLDYLKRGYSFFLHDEHPVRTIISSIAIPVAASFGYYDVMKVEPETTPVAAPAQKGAPLAGYIAQINDLGAPIITAQADWDKLDKSAKEMAAKAIMDPQLSEKELKSVVQMFTDKTRYRPPNYLWLQGTSKDLSYISECRQDVLQATSGNIMDYAKSAEQVYACAIRKEDNREALTVLPILFGSIIGFAGLLIGGGDVGRRWRYEFNKKKAVQNHQRKEKERLKDELARAAALPPPRPDSNPVVPPAAAAPVAAAPVANETPATPPKPTARNLNF